MDARNTFAFNRLRTLSIAMGVYTPLTESSAKMSPKPTSHALEGQFSCPRPAY